MNILVVDDEKIQRESLVGFLKKINHTVYEANSAQAALTILIDHPVEIIISDYKMPYMSGYDLLREVKERNPNIVVILITAFGSIERAVESMRMGAWDFLTKPLDLDKIENIIKAIERYLGTKKPKTSDRLSIITDENAIKAPSDYIIAEDKRTQAVMRLAKKVATTTTTVLITGETGTGKEVIAEFIHAMSPRSHHKMMTVNCAALPSTLIESELFGHEKGAFTGAEKSRKGRFEEADSNTLFLDEIGDLPLSTQVKLLRFLQNSEFQRLGSNTSLTSDVRIIAATNIDLEHAIKMHEFREDLYFRLNVFPIRIPPLRDRKDDIIPLAKQFLNQFTQREKRKEPIFSDAAKSKLIGAPFPGNVRELQNIIERALILSSEDKIAPDDIEIHGQHKYEGLIKDKIEELEKKLILECLNESDHNQSKCARKLGISERVLRYKLNKYGLR